MLTLTSHEIHVENVTGKGNSFASVERVDLEEARNNTAESPLVAKMNASRAKGCRDAMGMTASFSNWCCVNSAFMVSCPWLHFIPARKTPPSQLEYSQRPQGEKVPPSPGWKENASIIPTVYVYACAGFCCCDR